MPNIPNIYSVTENLQKREKIYIEVRKKEKRLYTDEVVKRLPIIDKSHFLSKEWVMRTDSYNKLKKYITEKNKPLQILDLGCGNGWMSNKISSLDNIKIIGVDVNKEELEQAERVFGGNKDLFFIYADIFDERLNLPLFDIIICASSIQYFQNLNTLLKRLLGLLNRGGEIHIIDSPLYNESNVNKAKKRSIEYYKKLGIEKMASYYYHHTKSELENYSYKIINESLMARFRLKFARNKSPKFPWIIIYKDK